MVRGTGFTAGLWVLGVAVHVGLDLLTGALAPAAEAVGSASILLFVAISPGAQALTVVERARVETPQAVLADR